MLADRDQRNLVDDERPGVVDQQLPSYHNIVVFEPRVRALLAAFPEMPARVIAEWVGLTTVR